MHDIRRALPEDRVNVFDCRVDEVIENPFSFTVMLRPADTDAPRAIGWEMDKPAWRRIEAPRVRICIPQEKILMLEE